MCLVTVLHLSPFRTAATMLFQSPEEGAEHLQRSEVMGGRAGRPFCTWRRHIKPKKTLILYQHKTQELPVSQGAVGTGPGHGEAAAHLSERVLLPLGSGESEILGENRLSWLAAATAAVDPPACGLTQPRTGWGGGEASASRFRAFHLLEKWGRCRHLPTANTQWSRVCNLSSWENL